jgi:hypothetical protein
VLFVVRISPALAFVLVGAAASAQDPPQSPQIHVSTHLVQIGIIVRNNNGPVADLKKDDFVVLDRGKPQKISVFTAESGASTPQPASPLPLPPHTFSDLPQVNGPVVRSITIVLLDNINTLSGNGHEEYETLIGLHPTGGSYRPNSLIFSSFHRQRSQVASLVGSCYFLSSTGVHCAEAIFHLPPLFTNTTVVPSCEFSLADLA